MKRLYFEPSCEEQRKEWMKAIQYVLILISLCVRSPFKADSFLCACAT